MTRLTLSAGAAFADAMGSPHPTPPDAERVKHTPGPWAWFGNEFGFYLATTHSGRTYVMDFVRFGMNRAQPRFRSGGIMRPAAEVVTFAVGDRGVQGFKAAKADPSVYRYDIDGVDHPDARLIAASPDLLAALKQVEAEMRAGFGSSFGETREQIRRAIAKAEGRT
jgi:hypothetical protein